MMLDATGNCGISRTPQVKLSPGIVRGIVSKPGQTLAIVLSCGVLAACGGPGPSLRELLSGPCTAGALGCPSDSAGKCSGSLVGLKGFCTPTGCAAGTEGCGCHPDGTCDAKAGSPMTCNGNVCIGAQAAPAGGLGGSCATDDSCTSTVEVSLICVQGACEQADCPSGRLGCSCGPFGMCQAVEGTAARCERGVCTLGGCAPGSVGCRCGVSAACGDGLSCDGGFCRRTAVTVEVGDPSARTCEVELDAAQRIGNVVFARGVRGKAIHRGAKLMIGFMSVSDASMGTALRLEPSNPGVPARLANATCRDGAGTALANALVALK